MVHMKYPVIKDFRDFINNCRQIRRIYGGVYSPHFYEKDYIANWREYIYSRTNISFKFRLLMWEYLNYDIDKLELINQYIKYKPKNKKSIDKK